MVVSTSLHLIEKVFFSISIEIDYYNCKLFVVNNFTISYFTLNKRENPPTPTHQPYPSELKVAQIKEKTGKEIS